MKGTRLWKPAGSPLIQGRSRRERSFLLDAAIGFVLAVIVAVGVQALASLGDTDSLQTLLGWALVPVAAGSAVGSLVGVLVASGFGWYPRWVSGAIIGALAAFGASSLFSGLIR